MLHIDEETIEDIERRFGSNRTALDAYLKSRTALGLPDHRRASSIAAPPREVAKAVLPAAKMSAPPKPVPAAPAPKAPSLSAAELERRRQQARHDQVMRSAASHGRQVTAAGLLGGAPDLSAEEIIDALAAMPTDAEAVAKVRRAQTDAMWDRVWNGGKAKAAAPKDEKRAAADAVWARVWERAGA